ncbi:ABC transporter sub-family G-like protein 5 [Sarcoptes scabiei]|uniref:ABC transporter sub-family G-like protein 5 n=1 Tax=Sarcoptes scabiei TaxID=52283 RepID=A0A131ZY81_SARSC|nr:ABC transporter sub-family G-like protein 5 [Sarcoptes scabiei]
MIDSNGCYPLDAERFNQTCQEELDNRLLTENYVNYQLAFTDMLQVISIGMSAIMLIDILRVFYNEHRNGWYSLGTFFWAFQLIFLAYLTVFSFNSTFFGYLTARYYSIDKFGMNWYRFGNFFLFYWLLMIYLQAHGQLWSIMLNNLQILIVYLQLIFSITNIFNGLSLMIEIMNKPIWLIVSKLIGIRYLSEGVLYSFFGIDRCDPQNEYSLVLKKYHINEEQIYWNLLPAIINIILLKFIGLLLMFWRFRLKTNRVESTTKNKKKIQTITLNRCISIDYDHVIVVPESTNNNEPNLSLTQEQLKTREILEDKFMIGWRNLCLFASQSIYETRSTPRLLYSTKTNERLILRNLNGQLRFGTLNALMGTSGSGKTSLLKVLNGRLKSRVSNRTKFFLCKFTSLRTCFITQEISGHLMPGMTALQTLIYASRFKNINETSKIDHQQIALNLLEELDLTDAVNTLVQNCSGGQRKRLALAAELTSIRMPNLICIDEPTSGLDSNSSWLVIQCLKKLVQRHSDITIVASIHQPNTQLLMTFDQCYVLARNGVCIYSGEPGQIRHYLDRIPESLEPNRNEDRFPIETLIKYSCTGHRNPVVTHLVTETANAVAKLDQTLLADTVLVKDGVAFNRNRFSLRSFWILCRRYFLFLIRHQWFEWFVFIIIYMAIAFSLAYSYDASIAEPDGCLNLNDDFNEICGMKSEEKLLEELRLANSFKYLVFMVILYSFALCTQTMFTFSNELKYFINEHRNGWYSCGAFYLMKFFYETLPMIPILIGFVYIVDFYSQTTPNNFYWWHVLLMILLTIGYQGISHLIVLISNRIFILMMILTASHIFFFLMLTGLFSEIDQMNFIFRFLSNFSMLRFVIQAGLYLIYGDQRCRPDEIQTILYQFRIPNVPQHLHECIMMLVALAFFFHFLALMALILKTSPIINRLKREEKVQKFRNENLLKIKNDSDA